MERKIMPGIILTLLLIGMLALAFKIQADLKTVYADDGNIVSPWNGTLEHSYQYATNGPYHYEESSIRVIEHKVTTLEWEKLKQKVGVWEEGRDYNQIIDGHGTGLRPPTQEEWAKILEEAYVVDEIFWGNQMADPPSSVDHTNSPWFPPIGNQGPEGSCVAWAVGYYVKTFQEAKEHGWDLSGAVWEGTGPLAHPTQAYQDRIFSPDFIYHLINYGVDEGSCYEDAISLVCSIGACSWEKMPYNPFDHTSWPSESAWREAPLYRGNSTGIEHMCIDTDTDITNLKNWIASGHLAVIEIDPYQYRYLRSDDVWTLDNYAGGGGHANTIVGYYDDLEYTEEGETRHGAFKIANSWGLGWRGDHNYDGCYWISYEAMKQRVGYCMFYHDRIGYEPELVASFRIDHSKRHECDITVGMGNTSAPIQTKRFNDYVYGGDHPFCPNDIVLDITEFKDAVPTVISQSFFMKVYDGGSAVPPAHSGMYEWYSDGVPYYSWFRLGQTFDIPETGATLKFWSYYEIEENWDYGYVEVHDLNADEWYTLPGLMTVSTFPGHQDNPNCPDEFEPAAYYYAGRWNAFTGFSSVMYQEEIDLTPFANHTIELYFTYWTDFCVLESGWYIDDIEIPEVGFFDDVESGPGDWTYNGWYITIPEPSLTGTISSFSIEYYYNYTSGTSYGNITSPDVPVNTKNREFVFAELILNIWIVDDDNTAGPWEGTPEHPYQNITSALEHASVSDTIYVRNGIYYENIVINKTLSLTGENPLTTTIDGNRTGTVVHIKASGVELRGFAIQNGGDTPIDCGIFLANSTGNTICNNIIRNNAYGLVLLKSNDSSFIGNKITNSSWAGVQIRDSNDNEIRENTIVNNSLGVYITSPSSLFNTFYHNNFIENTNQVSDFGNGTIWDNGYPSGGNFWSDYNGADLYSGPYQNETGSDGIGDAPYVIPPEDKYPLMSPWGIIPIPGDVNFDGMVNILDVVLAALAFGSAVEDDPNTPWNETKNWNPYADLNNDGIINIIDLVIIGVNFGKTW